MFLFLIIYLVGNGLSSHSVSLSELPKTSAGQAMAGGAVIRQRLTQRENSKDSAFDGSTVSVEEDASVQSRQPVLSGNVSMKPSLPSTKSESPTSPGAVQKIPAPPASDKYG